MFDMMQMGLPAITEAYGKKWMCVYRMPSSDTHAFFIAVEALDDGTRSKDLPQQCFVIGAPLPADQVKSNLERRAREEAEKQARVDAAIKDNEGP